MKVKLTLILLFSIFSIAFAQAEKEEIKGVVTYMTSQNVYVKFASAKKISEGDQLFVKVEGVLKPVLLVKNRSSVSCVGNIVGENLLKIGDQIIAFIEKDPEKVEPDVVGLTVENAVQDEKIHEQDESDKDGKKLEQKVQGRFLISSYSNISNLETDNNYKFRYTFSLNAANIANSRFSFENYISFTHKTNNWDEISTNIFNGLKIYSLNASYRLGERTSIAMGRKINPKISSIGAVDGVQFESSFKSFYFGAVAGYRPDYSDYSFNFDLLEYGAFLGHTLKSKTGRMQTSVALFEQTNAGNTDRRFAYFQHDNTLLKNFSFFISSELDLYRLLDGVPTSDLILTSLYASVRYRPIREFSIMCSYDNRRNIIYYETFKNYIDQLIQDATRQGFQMRLNFKPIKYMYAGLSGSYRMRDNDTRATRNVNGFLSYSNLPWIKSSITLTTNFLQNSYLSGSVYGARLTRDFMKGKMNAGLNYRYVNYLFEHNENGLSQNIGEIDVSYRFNRKFSLSLNYEGTFENSANYHRIYFNAVKRF
ncbi:MAG: hypothetical protein PF541_09515 [Prolixibacteraceae bacterium]|jgi:hypothetical protein|nr:hypothetical protein [Prolixibacteraceae bacterium]